MRFSVMLRVYDSPLVDSYKFLLQSDGGEKGKPRLKLRRGVVTVKALLLTYLKSFRRTQNGYFINIKHFFNLP